MKTPDSLSPLTDRRFAWFFGGVTTSIVGSSIAPIALTFAVLDLTGNSAAALGQVLAARSIPLVLFVLVGGVVADRLSRSFVLRYSNLASALTQAAVAALLLTGTAEVWMLILLEAVNGAVAAFTFPAIQGIIPQIVPRTHFQQANAMLSFSRRGLRILGPSVGALMVVTVGSGWAVAIDATTWFIASACMARIRVPTTRSTEQRTSGLRDLRDGWSAFTARTWVWVVVAAFAVLNAIQAGAFSTLGPMIAKSSPIGVAGWGYAESALAVGMVATTVLMLRWRPRFPLRAGMLGVGAFALPTLILGLQPQMMPLVALAFLAGCGIQVFDITWLTALQQHIPGHLLSRVSSYDMVGSLVAVPVGQLVFGPLAAVWPARDIVLVAGVTYVGVVLLTLASRSVRDLTETGSPDPQPVG